KIRVAGHEIGYPFESHIWQLPEDEQVEYLETIARAGCIQGTPMPEKFTEWIYWKLGKKIAETYMLPYNRKIFSANLDELGTYWLYKLPDVSFREVLMSCLRHAQFGTLPGHARFYYPKKYGYGEVFLRIADSLKGHILYETPVTSVDWKSLTVNGSFGAETIINTIPWCEFAESLPAEVRKDVDALK
ncbi:MAG: amine oxidoreductase, partial [Lentisphaeria bacterium]|nr:amine oxidoreductase [Lentisphaeria bacterium]